MQSINVWLNIFISIWFGFLVLDIFAWYYLWDNNLIYRWRRNDWERKILKYFCHTFNLDLLFSEGIPNYLKTLYTLNQSTYYTRSNEFNMLNEKPQILAITSIFWIILNEDFNNNQFSMAVWRMHRIISFFLFIV